MQRLQTILQYTVSSLILFLFLAIPLSFLSSHQPSQFPSPTPFTSASEIKSFDSYIEELYQLCNLEDYQLPFKTFKLGMIGFVNLNSQDELENEKVLSIVDYDKPSTEKRFYVIDLEEKRVKHHTIMAHGKKTGWDMATKFSNTPNSHQSSLGFYKTAETYMGKYGYSLRLDGLERGFNCKARDRAIVMHGADYVSQDFIKQHGRLGRSWGCLSLTRMDSKPVIDVIREGSCIYVHRNDRDYLGRSKVLNEKVARRNFEEML